MSDLRKKLASGIAAGALLLNLATPAFAGITIEVSGNGSDSENEVELEYEHEVEVTQSNYADVQNEIKAEASTGENEAEDNTGGNVEVESGDATTKVTVTNSLNSNVAKVDACCVGDVEAKISGNGTDSENEIELELENEVKVDQYNDALVINNVDAEAETGENEAEDNTGGSVKVTSGNAETTVAVSNNANHNSAWVTGSGDGGSLTALITGNGSDSENEIELELENETKIDQDNYADILNEIDAEAETGENEAEDNTGGEVEVESGDATVDVTVDNWVNFNWADVDACGCLEDILAKVSGNGTDSENEIEAEIEFETKADQYNDFDCKGEIKDACADVKAEAETGENEAEDNTVAPDEDPTISSGDASSTVEVTNSANSNVYGELPEDGPEWPWEGLSFNLNFSFDLQDLLAALLGD